MKKTFLFLITIFPIFILAQTEDWELQEAPGNNYIKVSNATGEFKTINGRAWIDSTQTVTSLTYNDTTKILSYFNEDKIVQTIDLSEFSGALNESGIDRLLLREQANIEDSLIESAKYIILDELDGQDFTTTEGFNSIRIHNFKNENIDRLLKKIEVDSFNNLVLFSGPEHDTKNIKIGGSITSILDVSAIANYTFTKSDTLWVINNTSRVLRGVLNISAILSVDMRPPSQYVCRLLLNENGTSFINQRSDTYVTIVRNVGTLPPIIQNKTISIAPGQSYFCNIIAQIQTTVASNGSKVNNVTYSLSGLFSTVK